MQVLVQIAKIYHTYTSSIPIQLYSMVVHLCPIIHPNPTEPNRTNYLRTVQSGYFQFRFLAFLCLFLGEHQFLDSCVMFYARLVVDEQLLLQDDAVVACSCCRTDSIIFVSLPESDINFALVVFLEIVIVVAVLYLMIIFIVGILWRNISLIIKDIEKFRISNIVRTICFHGSKK